MQNYRNHQLVKCQLRARVEHGITHCHGELGEAMLHGQGSGCKLRGVFPNYRMWPIANLEEAMVD